VKSLADVGLRDYPFAIVPPTEPTTIWADRESFRRELETLVRGWLNNHRSAMYLLWADFGAGKTHALRYLEAISATTLPACLPVYCDIPDSVNDFRGVYVQTVQRMPEQAMSDAIISHRRTAGEAAWLTSPVLRGDRDTARVLWLLADMGNQPQGDLARRWLAGERLGARDLATLGATAWIRTSEQAVKTLSTICRLILATDKKKRILLLFDEFQRVGQMNRKKVQDVNAGVASVFNACPDRFAVVLSYSFGNPENIKYMVSGEVLSRVVGRFQLPALTPTDGVVFVNELLAIYSAEGRGERIFSNAAIKRIVNRLMDDVGGKLTPRKVMQAFSTILDSALLGEYRWPLSSQVAMALYRAPLEGGDE
jgi:hypothetical protein